MEITSTNVVNGLNGAGEENRTPISCLGSKRSATELHPQISSLIILDIKQPVCQVEDRPGSITSLPAKSRIEGNFPGYKV